MVSDDTPIPQWLKDFQNQFTQRIRLPLDTSSGFFESPLDEDALWFRPVPSPHNSLKGQSQNKHHDLYLKGFQTYHKLHWYRLFSVLQESYPTTTWILGAWSFNHVAHDYVLHHPPRSFDIADVTPGFLTHFQKLVSRGTVGKCLPHKTPEQVTMALEASAIDHAWTKAQRQSPLDLPAAPHGKTPDLNFSMDLRLQLAHGTYIEEHWPLVMLRQTSDRGLKNAFDALDLPLMASPQYWWIHNHEGCPHFLALSAAQYHFYRLLQTHSLEESLIALEDHHALQDDSHPDTLARDIYHWMILGTRHHMWKIENSGSSHLQDHHLSSDS